MIRYRKTAKLCNICHREVAYQKLFRFVTTNDYVTLRMDCRSLFDNTDRDEVHICYRCWERMAEVIEAELEGE